MFFTIVLFVLHHIFVSGPFVSLAGALVAPRRRPPVFFVFDFQDLDILLLHMPWHALARQGMASGMLSLGPFESVSLLCTNCNKYMCVLTEGKILCSRWNSKCFLFISIFRFVATAVSYREQNNNVVLVCVFVCMKLQISGDSSRDKDTCN